MCVARHCLHIDNRKVFALESILKGGKDGIWRYEVNRVEKFEEREVKGSLWKPSRALTKAGEYSSGRRERMVHSVRGGEGRGEWEGEGRREGGEGQHQQPQQQQPQQQQPQQHDEVKVVVVEDEHGCDYVEMEKFFNQFRGKGGEENEGRRGEKNIDYCTNNTGTQC